MMEQKGAGLVQPGEEKVKRRLSCCHPVHCPTGLHGRETQTIVKVHREKTREDRHRLQQGKFLLDI